MTEDLHDGLPAEISVAMTKEVHSALSSHLDQSHGQEDLAFAYWVPSKGATRLTAILNELVLPKTDERILQGNVAFTSAYLRRALASIPTASGLAFLHSHLGPGWQGMSHDDIVAERDRIAGPAVGRSSLPLLGMTKGTDGAWSARLWVRSKPGRFTKHDATTVRVTGEQLAISFHPTLAPANSSPPTQEATVSVWGESVQADLARAHIGIVGLGSVGSIVNEALARMGAAHLTLIDHDIIENRNLDRTAGAARPDALLRIPKVEVAARNALRTATDDGLIVRPVFDSLLTPPGLAAAMDCDVLFSCVDRPWPRYVLNAMAYGHLIPVIDGGILARVSGDGRLLHIDWRIQTVGPDHRCLYCLDALRRSDVALDMEGMLDDIDYIERLPEEDRARYGRRNVIAFSLSVASHEVQQLVGLVSGNSRIGGIGPQQYHAYPGTMTAAPKSHCEADCEVRGLLSTAPDLSASI